MHPGVLLLYCTAMWPYYIAIASVFAAALFMRMEAQQRGGAAKEAAATRKTTAAAPPKEEVDEAEPSALIKAHALSGYAYLIARGKVLDIGVSCIRTTTWALLLNLASD